MFEADYDLWVGLKWLRYLLKKWKKNKSRQKLRNERRNIFDKASSFYSSRPHQVWTGRNQFEPVLAWARDEKTTQEDQNQWRHWTWSERLTYTVQYILFCANISLVAELLFRERLKNQSNVLINMSEINVSKYVTFRWNFWNFCFLQMRFNLLERTSLIRQQYRLLDNDMRTETESPDMTITCKVHSNQTNC